MTKKADRKKNRKRSRRTPVRSTKTATFQFHFDVTVVVDETQTKALRSLPDPEYSNALADMTIAIGQVIERLPGVLRAEAELSPSPEEARVFAELISKT